MIYDVVFSTGDVSVSGCSSNELETNTFDILNREAVGSLGEFYYDRTISTGQREVSSYVNGQSLLQEIPFTQTITNEVFYNIKTGDFFTKGDESNAFDQSKLYFDSTTPVNGESQVTYNIITGGIFAGTGDLGLSLNSGISGQYSVSDFKDYHYFLNGVKVYSGAGVGIAVGAGTTQAWQFSFGVGVSEAGGVVSNENKNEFKYTAHRKRSKTTSETGRYSDFIFTDGYIEKRNNYYVNGILQPQSNYLELFIGVNTIKTGFDATISGGLAEILSGSSLVL